VISNCDCIINIAYKTASRKSPRLFITVVEGQHYASPAG